MGKTLGCALALVVGICAASVGCSDDSDNTNAGQAGSAGASSGPPGPGAALKCTSSGKNAFDTYGLDAFVKVNDALIGNVATEINKGTEPGFGNTLTPVASDPKQLAALKSSLAQFLVYVYGGPNNYKGKSMFDAHSGLGLTRPQYDYFLVNVVVPALTSSGVSLDDVNSCFAPPLKDEAFIKDFVLPAK